ncbi:MAG: Fe2+-dependent dioxygenase [Litorimonas sp.]
MIFTLANVLDADSLAAIHADLDALRWTDGTDTAGPSAAAVKRNRQADLSNRVGVRVRDRLVQAVEGHPVLRAAAQPARFSRPLLSRTERGGGYGLHVDNAFMESGGNALRTDLSYTLFLSPPGAYEGGALRIEEAGGTQTLRPEAGSLVLYASTSLHAVEPVTHGTRIVCVGWVESRVRDAERREILFDLENLAATLGGTFGPQTMESLTLAKVIANLRRTFS